LSKVICRLVGDPEKFDADDQMLINQSDPLQPCHFALEIEKTAFLSGRVISSQDPEEPGLSRWKAWRSHPEYDLAEWTIRAGTRRVTRTLFMLRGRGLGFFAEQVEGVPRSAKLTVPVAHGVQAVQSDDARGIVLTSPKSKQPVHVWPVGLPAVNYETERGRIAYLGTDIVLTQAIPEQRGWLPLLFSWHPKRDRRPAQWRQLTVTQDRKTCGPGIAFAVRAGWKDEPYSFVIYRSLAAPASRCFLGHQTDARMLIGLFSPDGEVEPIVTLDD
jgi:hypothetical protein